MQIGAGVAACQARVSSMALNVGIVLEFMPHPREARGVAGAAVKHVLITEPSPVCLRP